MDRRVEATPVLFYWLSSAVDISSRFFAGFFQTQARSVFSRSGLGTPLSVKDEEVQTAAKIVSKEILWDISIFYNANPTKTQSNTDWEECTKFLRVQPLKARVHDYIKLLMLWTYQFSCRRERQWVFLVSLIMCNMAMSLFHLLVKFLYIHFFSFSKYYFFLMKVKFQLCPKYMNNYTTMSGVGLNL